MTLVYWANGMPPASSSIPWHTHGHHWHGYWIGNDNSYHPASYKHTSKSLHGLSPPTRVKATTNAIYVWQFKYANTMPTVTYMYNDLIYDYIAGINFCPYNKMKHHVIFTTIYWNYKNIIPYNMPIIWSWNNIADNFNLPKLFSYTFMCP